MPTLRQLQYLVALDDTRHFGRAADTTYVSQPTLSQQIRELEHRLGAKLVERGRPVRLTPIGRDVVARARRVMRDVAEIKALAAAHEDGMAGTIRVGVSPTIGPYLMPLAVVRLHQKHPNLRLYIREGIPDEQFNELRNGALDMMLAPLPVPGGDLHIEPLFREPLCLVATPDNALLKREPLPREALRGAPILSLDPRHHYHRQIEGICNQYEAELLRDYEGTSLDSLRQMAGSGLGMAILPELYLRSETGGEDMVKRIKVEGWNVERSVAAVWRNGAAYAQSFAAIAEVVAAEAREMLT
ncbi:hydrogen peroxide-inducible genes activator [Erythrobacter sp. HKB08]|uniref:hydrogen peroxide-inducible genes activator n=1 Tax=Erythrobacter sp. HKB08 TaxID=2502843 RepID=UPI0010092420|nr:hydrogen peroxide-inducible genes activator [Erythrobacter sp. HKB08]